MLYKEAEKTDVPSVNTNNTVYLFREIFCGEVAHNIKLKRIEENLEET